MKRDDTHFMPAEQREPVIRAAFEVNRAESQLLAIGIDPGKDTTGIFIVRIRTQEVVFTKTCKYLDALGHIDHYPPEVVAAIVIEDPGLNNFAYSRNTKGTPEQNYRIQRNAGMNQQIAHFLIETLRQRGYKVKTVRPTPKHLKWKSHLYRQVTRDQSRVSQHVRDAARLVAGMHIGRFATRDEIIERYAPQLLTAGGGDYTQQHMETK